MQGMSDDFTSSEAFCRRSVEPMGEESDHIQAVALCDAVGVPVRIMYLDSNLHGAGAEANSHDFEPSADGGGGGGGANASIKVHTLYRPGHYDILYPL
jgi:ubiquitin thioesterase protein OTUB1